MTSSNPLCNCYVVNTNPKSAYAGFRLQTCLELADPDGGTFIEPVEDGDEYIDLIYEALDDPFYRVFAVYGEGHVQGHRVIADFYNVNEACAFLRELTGSSIDIYSR